MNSVLFDTDIVANWHQNNPRFSLPIEKLFNELSKHGAMITRFVSAVTVQELSFWAVTQGDQVALDHFLSNNFSTLIFDRITAVRAAELQRDVGRPPKVQPKSADREQVDRWFRDAAIVATASQHKIKAIVTADYKLRRDFQPHFLARFIL